MSFFGTDWFSLVYQVIYYTRVEIFSQMYVHILTSRRRVTTNVMSKMWVKCLAMYDNDKLLLFHLSKKKAYRNLTSYPRRTAIWKDRSCNGITVKITWRQSTISGTLRTNWDFFWSSKSLSPHIMIGFPCINNYTTILAIIKPTYWTS